MDTDKIKIFGARVRVDGTGKLAELERAEKVSFGGFWSDELYPIEELLLSAITSPSGSATSRSVSD